MTLLTKKLFILLLVFLLILIAWPSMALERVSGDKVTFAWDPSTGAEGYFLLFAPYPNADHVGEIDVGNQTRVTFDIWEGASFYVGVQAYNKAGRSGISNIVSFVASSEGLPHPVTLDITANGLHGPLEVFSGTRIRIWVNLALEDYWGQDVDCWIAEKSPYGWFSYVPSLGWIPGIQPYRGSDLSWLNSAEILNMALPAGEYVFYVALDNNADTIPDATWWKSVTVKVRNRVYFGGR
jgi:hypothetical protein